MRVLGLLLLPEQEQWHQGAGILSSLTFPSQMNHIVQTPAQEEFPQLS